MFEATLIQVTTLLIYILVGYFLRRKNIVHESTGKVLSKLLTCVFTPCYTISNLSKNISVERVNVYLSLIIAAIIIFFVLLVISLFTSKLLVKDENIRNMFLYMLLFSNMGYFGCPLIEKTFGAESLVQFLIFTTPLSVAINTYGYYILVKPTKAEILALKESGNEQKINYLKLIISPPLVGVTIGIILGFMPFDMPEIFYNILSPAGNCMSASAMILTGAILAKRSFKELFVSLKSYILAGIKLIIYPIIIGGALFLIGVSKDVFIAATCMACLPAGMNVVVFPESVGKDSIEGAKACFVQYFIAILTIPIVFYLLESLAVYL